MKTWVKYFIPGILPFAIAIGAWGLDALEATLRGNYWMSDPILYWWLAVAIRTVFGAVLVTGIWLFFRRAMAGRAGSVIWFLVGLILTLLSSPVAPFVRTALQLNPVKLPEPTHLVLIAGTCLMTCGGIGLFQRGSGK